MDNHELKAAWQALERQIARQERVQMDLLREGKLGRARGRLRPLVRGQVLQFLLGAGLVLLGIACWKANLDVPGLLATGVIVHAFGVVTAAAAGTTLGLIRSVDYSAPVVQIQAQLERLRRFHTVNGIVCGVPWWVMWVLVVVAVSGLGGGHSPTPAPMAGWAWASLAIGVAGTLATWALYAWAPRLGWHSVARFLRNTAAADSLRRAQLALDELDAFERE